MQNATTLNATVHSSRSTGTIVATASPAVSNSRTGASTAFAMPLAAGTSAARPPTGLKRELGKGKDAERETTAIPTPAPAWSEMKTKAGKERKRLPLACKSCRRKKVRCSGETPACKHCLRAKIPCVYKVTQRKATPRTDYMTMLDKRLKRMEERVIKLIPQAESAKISVITRASVKPPSMDKAKTTSKKRAAVEAFAQEHEEEAKQQQQKQQQEQEQQQQQNPKDPSETSSLVEGREHLPDKEMQEHLAETYFDFCYGQPYHLLHKPSFMRRLREGSLPAVLMLTVCAVSARFSTHPHFGSEPPSLRGEQWALEARRIAARSFTDPNLTIIIVVTLLALYDFGSCQGGRAWMHSGIAMRMCYALQLNQEYEKDTSGVGQIAPLKTKDNQGKDSDESSAPGIGFTDQEIRRRTMWACYLMDCFNSSGTKRPLFDHIQHMKIQLPIKEAYFQLEIPGRTEDINGEPGAPPLPEGQHDNKTPRENMGIAAYLIKTLALWAKVVAYSNTMRMHSDKKPPWHEESDFAKLATKVKHFGQTLPNFLRYTPENYRSHNADRLGSQFAFMHVIYQQVILFLHKFTIPAFPGSKIPPEMPKDFLLKARRTAVEAASKISKVLEDSKGSSLTAPFASYCSFASSTVHIWGMFSKEPKLADMSKASLSVNMRYLSRMKRYWSMVHYMTESLRDIYRQHADAARSSGVDGPRKLSEEIFFEYGDIQDREQPVDAVEGGSILKQPQSPSSKAKAAELGSKSKLMSVSDWFQTKGSPQLNSAEIPNRPAKRGKQSHGTPPTAGDAAAARMDTSSIVSHTPTPPDTTGSALDPMIQPQQTSQAFANSAQSRFAAMSNPYQDRNLAASFTMASALNNAQYSRLPMQSFDRQLVYGAYAQDPSFPYNPSAFETSAFDASAENELSAINLLNGAIDPGLASQIGMDPVSAAGIGMTNGNFVDASAAWLTPFHMVPPVNLVQPEYSTSSMNASQVNGLTFGMADEGNSGNEMDFWNT